MTDHPRTSYRNRRQALRAWRDSVRDLAVVALYEEADPVPLVVLAARIGVDAGGLRGLLEPDARFVVRVAAVPRRGWGTRTGVMVGLRRADLVRSAAVGNIA